MARGFLFFVFALFALVLSVMAQGPAVKSPKNNRPDAAKAEGSEWVDEDPRMQLAGDAGPAEVSRAKVFLEATTASGSPSAPNEAPKETGHVPAPGKYTHVTSGGAKLGAIPLPEEGFPRLWHPPAPAPAPAAPPAPAPAPASSKKGKAVAGAAAPKAPKAAPPAKAPKKDNEKKKDSEKKNKDEPAVLVVPSAKKGAEAPAAAAPAVAVAAPAPAPIDSSVVSVASADVGGDEARPPRHGLATSHVQVDDDGNVLRCHTGPDGEERCH